MCIHNVTVGEDYDAGPYEATFLAGETHKSVDIEIYNDHVLEGNENVNFVIQSEFLPKRISRGIPFKTRLNILDDDGKNDYQ